MARIWSDEGKLERWLQVELAALAAWAEVGAVPAEAAVEIRTQARPPSPARVAEIEQRTHHDVAAFVDAVAGQLGPAGRWFHYGLTSSDVVDTALALQLRAAGELILTGLDRSFDSVVARAEEHRLTITIGRTHGVHAEPTTFGLKLAVWAFELDRARGRIARALEGVRIGKLSGAVGNYAAIDPEVERLTCERLGLEPEPAATQVVQRDRHAELLAALAVAAASLERFALEIRHLRICGLARVVRAASLVGLENVALWHERDISHSSAERVTIPDAFLALDYMLDRFAWLAEGLVVRPDQMRRNLDSSHGLFFSQRLLLALVAAGLSRDDAYRLVQSHAMRAWEEERDFPELVRADTKIAERLDAGALDAVFDLDQYTRHVDTIFDRLTALTRKEEPVHV